MNFEIILTDFWHENSIFVLYLGGANRFNLPQWLLLAMAGSGIWRDEQFPQVQGVAYIHETPDISGGNFFLYPSGK